MKTYGFKWNLVKSYVYKLIKVGKMIFLVIYMDIIMLIWNSVEALSNVKYWLFKQFQMKDLG